NGLPDPNILAANNPVYLDAQVGDDTSYIGFNAGVSDFNLDGFPDFLTQSTTSGTVEATYFVNETPGAATEKWDLAPQNLTILTDLVGGIREIRDVNADGLADLLIESEHQLYLRLNTTKVVNGVVDISFAPSIFITDKPVDDYTSAFYFAGKFPEGASELLLSRASSAGSYLALGE
ncbi:MAG: hypothetical protein GY869_31090, partial [Planctomycetes bacterium]|nr:hypothetical protein [Planctomycetota bacterium]